MRIMREDETAGGEEVHCGAGECGHEICGERMHRGRADQCPHQQEVAGQRDGAVQRMKAPEPRDPRPPGRRPIDPRPSLVPREVVQDRRFDGEDGGQEIVQPGMDEQRQ